LEKLGVMTNNALTDSKFWLGKRVLVTGHSGFKGSWLTLWLQSLGAQVTGISLPPNTAPSLFTLANIDQKCHSQFCDIRDLSALTAALNIAKPEIIFHLAAQSLVRASYRDPIETFSINVMGTANLLEALRVCGGTRVAVMITTDKVYRNHEMLLPYKEDDPLGGFDPYSASKAASEIVISSYRDSFLAEKGIAVASARAGNVIGGGDWSEDRLIPDAIRAWQKGDLLDIRRPNAIRPWQHVLEPLGGYLMLAKQLWDSPSLAGAYNFGPESSDATSVHDVIQLARAAYGKGDVRYAKVIEGPHEAGLLTLEIKKAKEILGVKPRLTLDQAITLTMDWYREQEAGANACDLCDRQIKLYEEYCE
jgi:CDP-glucose 4,6-dehydratase